MIYRCYDCGREIDINDDDSPTDSNWWCDEDGDWHCEECWSTCDHCGERDSTQNLTYVEATDCSVCEECLNERYATCPICGWVDEADEMRWVDIVDNDGNRVRVEPLCDECCGNHTHYDDSEGETFLRESEFDNLRRTGGSTNMDGHIFQESLEPNASVRCPDCSELGRQCPKCLRKEAEMLLKEETNLWVYDTQCRDYHAENHHKFKCTKYRFEHEHPYLYYGIELEVLFKSGTSIQTIAMEYIKATNGLFVAEYDRSVTNNGNGCEFISRPLSYKKWTSKEVIQLLEEGKKVLEKYQAYSPQPNVCGLHVHMSLRFFEENTTKKVKDIKSDIDWMFQIFQPEMEKLSQRKYTRYCASKASRLQQALQNNPLAFNLSSKVTLEKGQLTVSRGSGDTHHDAIIQTPKTIEVRTFNSSIITEEILATIELCRAIAHASRNMDIKTTNTLGDILYCKDSTYLEPFIKKQKVDTTKKFTNKLEVKING